MARPQPSADGFIHNPNVPEDTEDLANGLYLHPDAPILTITRDGKTEVYVAASKFMEVQKERDEYRRVLALVNAWRLKSPRSEIALRQLLMRVGEGDAQGEATLDIIRWVERERAERNG